MIYSTLISTATLARHLDDPPVRHRRLSATTWPTPTLASGVLEAAHIPGAQFLHLDRDLSAHEDRHATAAIRCPRSRCCAATFGRIGIDATKQVVAYDQNAGMWASRLWWMLRWLGHEAVAVLDGGLDKLDRRRPTDDDRRAAQSRRRAFVAQPPRPVAVQPPRSCGTSVTRRR